MKPVIEKEADGEKSRKSRRPSKKRQGAEDGLL